MKTLAWGALVLAGCASSAQLRAKAAVDLKCDQVRVDGVEGWDGFARASGCGRQGWYGFDGKRWVSPSERAAVELNCPVEEMTLTSIDATTVRVSGCDQKADYVLVDGVSGARWQLRRTDNPLSRAP